MQKLNIAGRTNKKFCKLSLKMAALFDFLIHLNGSLVKFESLWPFALPGQPVRGLLADDNVLGSLYQKLR